MQIVLKKISSNFKANCLVVFAAQEKSKSAKKATRATWNGIDNTLATILKEAEKDGSLSGAVKETLFFRHIDKKQADHLLVVGLGPKEKITHETLRNAAAEAYKTLNKEKITAASFLLTTATAWVEDNQQAAQALTEGVKLASYQYEDHKAKPSPPAKKLEKIEIAHDQKANPQKTRKAVKNGEIIAESVNFARWLGDTPGNLMTPDRLAKETQKAAKNTGLRVSVWDKARIKREKFGGLYGVSLGSSVDPRFIIMEYKGATPSKKPLCYVGKGLTFDSGGISIKPAASMDEMKYDMCGGANVIATMIAIARLKLKVNALGLVPASENMPGPLANKPGDILRARNGKTVEVLNTDAEGRLILMDALSYASEKKPEVIFDAATLTGAMLVALGKVHTGYFTRQDSLEERIEKAAEASGEQVWRLPVQEEHVTDMKGTFADLQNIGKTRFAGSSKAAAFLSQFVDEKIPWAHFDIAGSGWHCGENLSYCPPKGATGSMVRTFVELAKSYS